ncbi:MAG: hypothetical protein ACRDHF_04620, partial [Tepidiformaceae bacterium]
ERDLPYLRRALARCRSRESAPTRRYPPRLRQEVTAYALRRIASGASLKLIASETGASLSTLQRWVRGAPRRRWRRVELAEPAAAAVGGREPMGAVLVSPGGYRIEGLDVAGLASLLRGLR